MSDEKTILVVDDDEIILSSIADILRLAGYRLLMATDGSKGLQVLAYHTPDLIVSDIAMPVMDGYEFYDSVRKNSVWTRIPFIFLTARGEKKDIQRGYRLGADHYLTKPFEPDDLLVAVESRLQRAAEVQAVNNDELTRTKEELTAVFRSELQGPLIAMYDHLSMLEEGHRSMSNEVVGRLLHSSRNETLQLVRVVEDLMLLAQIESGLIRLEVERYYKPTSLGPLLDGVIRDLRPKAEGRNISLAYSQTDLSVIGMADYVKDFLARLIDNAIKFGEYEGYVRIKAKEQGGIVTITIEDDGIGIEPEQMADLFNPRARIASMDQTGQHVGLGLGIANGLVLAHGGTLQVDSRPAEGTTFTVTLPAATSNQ